MVAQTDDTTRREDPTTGAAELGRILLVDDEEDFRVTTQGLLRRQGYHCDGAGSAEEALPYLQHPYDLMILDIMMPGNQELEFLKELRTNSYLTPVIVVTGYPSVSTAVEAMHMAVVDYQVKPLQLPAFFHSVVKAVQKGKMLRAIRDVQTTAKDWEVAMEKLEHMTEMSSEIQTPNSIKWTLDMYLAEAMKQMAKLSVGMQATLSRVREGEGGSGVALDVCQTMHCPRLSAYEAMLLKTVDVLEKTKRAFKSKDLGELREQIERLLKQPKES